VSSCIEREPTMRE